MCLVTALRYGGVGVIATDTISVLNYTDGSQRQLRLGGKIRRIRGGYAAATGRSNAMARLGLNVLERECCSASDPEACAKALQAALREHEASILDAYPGDDPGDTRIYVLPADDAVPPYLVRADTGFEEPRGDCALGLPPDLEMVDVKGLEADFAASVRSSASVQDLLRAVADLFADAARESEMVSDEVDLAAFTAQGTYRTCRTAEELRSANDEGLVRMGAGRAVCA